MSGKKDFRAGRSGEKSFPEGSKQGVKLMERDPGAEFPVWTHGPASAFVVAQQFMEARAKAAGVFDIWTGKEKTELGYPKPTISYILDSSYAEAYIREDSAEGQSIAASSIETPATNTEGVSTPRRRAVSVFRSPGGLISLQDPRYYPADGETEEFSGLEFGRLVQRTNSFEKYTYAANKTREQSMKWEEATTYKRRRVALADAVLTGCLGASANAVVKPYLRRGDIAEAWDALRNKYARPGDAVVISQLNAHLRNLEMKRTVRLEEFLNQVDVLREALGECGAPVDETECLNILKGAVLVTAEGKDVYGPAFTTARHAGWDMDELIDALTSDCHELIQSEGIAAIKNAEFQRELQRRKTVSDPKPNDRGGANNATVDPSANNASKVITAGTDGATHPDTPCYKCQEFGHIARNCPQKKSSGAAAPSNRAPKPTAKATEADTEEEEEEERDRKGPAASKPKSILKPPAPLTPARAVPTPDCSSASLTLTTQQRAVPRTPTWRSPRRCTFSPRGIGRLPLAERD